MRQLDSELVARLQRNDRATAWDYAFDSALLRRNGVEVDTSIAYSVAGQAIDRQMLLQTRVTIELRSARPLPLRLDALLAQQLGLSRRELAELAAYERLAIAPGGRAALRSTLKSQMTIVVDAARLDESGSLLELTG